MGYLSSELENKSARRFEWAFIRKERHYEKMCLKKILGS